MKSTRFIPLLFVIMFLSMACGINISNPKTVDGSGISDSETRSVQEFTAIELAGSGDVTVTIGEIQSVVVEADDNILPLIETNVKGGKLVISTKPFTSINPNLPVRVTVTVKVLEAAKVSGSGNITIQGLMAKAVRFDLPGSGNISAAGTTEKVTISLNGSGNILCDDLKAQSAIVDLNGSGTINVYASESLDATIKGSGTVQYSGNPAHIKQSVSGSGTIIPIQ
jgi:hypothetical protein